MTSKVITTYIASGYALSASYSQLTVTAAGGIGGTGLYAGASALVFNYGSIQGSNIAANLSGGVLTNGAAGDTAALIEGGDGVVESKSAATVRNFATIEGVATTSGAAGVALNAGGSVINGSAADTTALIESAAFGVLGSSAPASVTNYGTVLSTNPTAMAGVQIFSGAMVRNGSTLDKSALIEGAAGVSVVGTVVNYATILATEAGQWGALLVAGGALVNGSNADTAALVQGGEGVVAYNGASTIANFGEIYGANDGIYLNDGGSVTNGSATDTTAAIVCAGPTAGGSGAVDFEKGTVFGTGTIVNFGTILDKAAADNAGAAIGNGLITNGSTADSTAFISGFTGLEGNGTATVVNFGTVQGTGVKGSIVSVGAYVQAGRLTNGAAGHTAALIEGGYDGLVGGALTAINWGTIEGATGDGAILLGGAASPTLTNFGTVKSSATGRGVHSAFAGAYFKDGGQLINGAGTLTTALIQGFEGVLVYGAAGTVTNFGSVLSGSSRGEIGVYLAAGGAVTNGSTASTAAYIQGWRGVQVGGAAGTVANFGTIVGALRGAVLLYDGGMITNGAATDTTALLSGGTAGVSLDGPGSLHNFGSINGQVGVQVQGTIGFGHVINGAYNDLTARITGGDAVYIGNYTTPSAFHGVLENYGQIIGGYGSVVVGGTPFDVGVVLHANGVVNNGVGGYSNALISGYSGVALYYADSVNNQATIQGTGAALGAYGVRASMSATSANLDNVSTRGAALISGYGGIQLFGADRVLNFGTILGTGAAATGAYVGGNGNVYNGASSFRTALISGGVGLDLVGAGTVTNWGTIKGTGGQAIIFKSASDTLIVEAGSTIIGAVDGGGGVIDFAGAMGTLSGLGGGAVTLNGSTPTTFANFATFEIGGAGPFILSGAGTIAAGQTLDVVGALTSTGGLIDAGANIGSGVLSLIGGASTFSAGATLSIARVIEGGGAATSVTMAVPILGVTGSWNQSAGTVTVASGDRVNFSGAGDVFSGTLSGAGTIAFTGGSDLLAGVTLSAAVAIINGASVTLSGGVTLAGSLTASTPNLIVGQTPTGAANLKGGGTLNLSNLATNRIVGAGAGATLTNVNDTIKGAGQIGAGSLVLVNDAAGLIEGNLTNTLIINTGTSTIQNAGTIENVGQGGVTIVSALNNMGTLAEAVAGTLTVAGKVIGGGVATINGGVLDVVQAFAETVTFKGAGVFELNDSVAFTGKVAGLSKTGTNSLDLADIAFISGTTKASYSGTTASGVLTVTDGTHTAKITLLGNYLSAAFQLSMDSAGGTIVIDPPAVAPSSAAPAAVLAQAAASFQIGTAPHLAGTPAWRLPRLPELHTRA